MAYSACSCSDLSCLGNLPLLVHTAWTGSVMALKLRLIELANQEGKADAPPLARLLSALRSARNAFAHRTWLPSRFGRQAVPRTGVTTAAEKESLPT